MEKEDKVKVRMKVLGVHPVRIRRSIWWEYSLACGHRVVVKKQPKPVAPSLWCPECPRLSREEIEEKRRKGEVL